MPNFPHPNFLFSEYFEKNRDSVDVDTINIHECIAFQYHGHLSDQSATIKTRANIELQKRYDHTNKPTW